MEEWRQILIQKIETAFAETPFPERQGFSVSGYSFETAGIEGKHWRELELGLLSSACNEMYHFGAEVRFYLPAFLRAAVLHPQEMDMLQDPLLYLFAPPRPDDRQRKSDEMLRRSEQLSSVAAGNPDLESSVQNTVDILSDWLARQNEVVQPDWIVRHFVSRARMFDSSEKAAIAAFFEKFLSIWPDDVYIYTELDKEKVRRAAGYWKAASGTKPPGELEEMRAELIHRIETAFTSAVHPGEDKVIEREWRSIYGTYPNFESDEEWRKVSRKFGEEWHDVLPESVSATPLIRFTPKGFRYYLPAYLQAALTHSNWRIYDELVPYPWTRDLALFFFSRRRLRLFKREESLVILDFFKYVQRYLKEEYSDFEWSSEMTEDFERIRQGIRYWNRRSKLAPMA